MKCQQFAAYFATCATLTTSIAAPSDAASITTATGGGLIEDYGGVSDEFVLQLLDNPVSTLSNLELDGPPFDIDSANVPSSGASTSSASSYSSAGSSGTARANITFNDSVLNFKTFAEGTLLQQLDIDNVVFAAGGAFLNDTPTISSSTTTGDGFYQLTFNLTGQTSGTGLGALAVSSNGALVYRNNELLSAQQITTSLIPTTFGTPFDLNIGFASFVGADDESPAGISGTADFEDTLTLTQIGVFDVNGKLVNDFTFTSDSGINYPAEPVPEPSSVLGTLAIGAFGAGLMLKRRHKQKVAGR